jgi:diadenosine tetraphosphate (Ap4A) HIT family hydrolase
MKPAQKIINSEPACIDDSVNAPWTDLEIEDFHVKVFNDAYPVTPGHKLYVPQYNNVDVLRDAVIDAVSRGLRGIENGEWDGFNVGMNVGTVAGQTCAWPHVHLIPRRQGDMEDPRGGVRHVIPERGNYKKW